MLVGAVLAGTLVLLALGAFWDGRGTGEGTAVLPGERGEKTKKEPPAPYEAVPPPEDATLLAERDVEVDARLERKALGRDGERSVPVGRTLLAGASDASDGPLKDHRLVAYYGTPLSDQMGVLGEHPPERMMELLRRQAAAYSAADPERPAVPTIELIASIAQREPGADGLYVAQTDPGIIREYARLAREHGALLMLDVQLGRASVMEEVRALREFLEMPHVHLAIDTEYAVGPGEVPGVNLGSVDGSEINRAIRYLDRIVEEKGIPDKVLLVHQFQSGIVTGKDAIRPTDDVQVVLHADGFGRAEDKFMKYRVLVREQPVQYGGFKVFYNLDEPVLEPEQVLMLDPAPAVVTYQ
ncbi:hypothetical protein [Rubrobacter xylanophilus]|uniref:hypothetical protein n=1 Tax=Rubrobacter xylanophilus TaxID=49319 RepID=UPI001FCC53FB|nr:hypothetical protein [Rubrobacter xylanophilus]